MPAPIVFLHIPKSAGVSLGTMLAEGVAPEVVYPEHGRGGLAQVSAEDWRRHRLFSGHFDYDELTSAPEWPRIVTMMRDPVERALALYWYWRTFTAEAVDRDDLTGPRYARSVDLKTFFTSAPPHIAPNFEEAIVRQLVGQSHCLPFGGFTVSEDEALALAMQRLDAMAAVGITERFEASAGLILRTLKLPLVPMRRDNSFAERAASTDQDGLEKLEASEAVLEHIRARTRLDRALYDHGCARLEVLLKAEATATVGPVISNSER